jgi:hypothetical protein
MKARDRQIRSNKERQMRRRKGTNTCKDTKRDRCRGEEGYMNGKETQMKRRKEADEEANRDRSKA